MATLAELRAGRPPELDPIASVPSPDGALRQRRTSRGPRPRCGFLRRSVQCLLSEQEIQRNHREDDRVS